MSATTRTIGRLALSAAAAAGLALAGSALPGCASSRTTESTGEYVDNSVITTRVKAAIMEEASLKSLQISVKSFKDVVQLSGFVDSAQSARLAAQVAARVPGVASVKNDLIVK